MTSIRRGLPALADERRLYRPPGSGYPAPREVPAGKILIAEYGDPDQKANRAIVELIASAPPRASFPGRRLIDEKGIRLIWSSPGYECAGSCARWTNGYWCVRWFDLGTNATHGHRYHPDAEGEAKARERFRRLTEEVS